MEIPGRYGIYVLPDTGPLADWGARWLGWDARSGAEAMPPEIDGLPCPVAELTATPRKYGFHGTIKPPFRLAEGCDPRSLQTALEGLCAKRMPVRLPGLRLTALGGFLALVPHVASDALATLAADTVRQLDRFRAPAGAEELARRRAADLSPQEEANLGAWGYPYVMESFRFHITLTGKLPGADADQTVAALRPVLDPMLEEPFMIDRLALVHSGEDGRFARVGDAPLLGGKP